MQQQTIPKKTNNNSNNNGIPKKLIGILAISIFFATAYLYVTGLDIINTVPMMRDLAATKVVPNFIAEVKEAKILTKAVKEEEEMEEEEEESDGSVSVDVKEDIKKDMEKDAKKKKDRNDFTLRSMNTTLLASNTTFQVFREEMKKYKVHMTCSRGVFGGAVPFSFSDKLAKVQIQSGLCVNNNKASSTSTTPLTKFVVLSKQHSGTSWLATELNRHPQVFTKHEIMYKTSRIAKLGDWNWQNTYHESVCMLYSSSECTGKRNTSFNNTKNDNNVVAAGYGIQGNQGWLNHTNLELILPKWKENNVRVIVMERRNEIARHYFAHSAVHKERNDPLVPLTHNILYGLKKGTEKHHGQFNAMKSLVKKAGVPMHYVTYESLVKTPGESFASIFDFIFGTSTTKKNDKKKGKKSNSRWEIRMSKEKGSEGIGTLTDTHNAQWQLKFGGHHSKPLKEKINNYNESKTILNEIYPNGACMLDEDCDWFYETETTY